MRSSWHGSLTIVGEMWLNTQANWWAGLIQGWSLTWTVLFFSWVFTRAGVWVRGEGEKSECAQLECDGHAECAGKKRRESLLCFQAHLCTRVPLFLVTTSFPGFSVRKWFGCLPLPPIFKRKSPRDGPRLSSPILATQTTHTTLKSLDTLHLLGKGNIRSQTE